MHMTHRTATALTLNLALGISFGGPRAALAQPASSTPTATVCTVAALASRAPAGTTIVKAEQIAVTATAPAYCQVDTQVATPGNVVNVRLRLPANWNGKFYFFGTGGYAGSVEPNIPAPGDIRTMLPGLLRGYAVASTDTGHQAAGTDASWALNNRAKVLDYADRGIHAATVAGKAVTASLYGAPPRLSYFAGCSNGGRQALMEAQRYPDDFDGILAGDPGVGTTSAARPRIFQVLLASQDTYLPTAKLDVISREVTAACDESDGLKDGLVSNPPACAFKPETLLCRNGDGPDCLTSGQVETLTKLYAGFSTADKKFVARGFPVGHESGPTGWAAWITGAVPPERQADGTLAFTSMPPVGFTFQQQNVRYLAFENADAARDWRAINFDRDAPAMQFMSDLLKPTADLRAFRARGGRLITYHGWADPAISAYSTIDYYADMARAVGGESNRDGFARLFLAPGMNHCQNGPGPNAFLAEALAALEAWVEQGKAPESFVATHANAQGVVDRSRPLCAYPMVAVYKGTGSIDDAANFVCRKP